TCRGPITSASPPRTSAPRPTPGPSTCWPSSWPGWPAASPRSRSCRGRPSRARARRRVRSPSRPAVSATSGTSSSRPPSRSASRFLREFDKSVPVCVAFWLKQTGRRYWHLYVASEQITDENIDRAYGEVIRVAGKLQDPWFDPLSVKVIGADTPLAKAAQEL